MQVKQTIIAAMGIAAIALISALVLTDGEGTLLERGFYGAVLPAVALIDWLRLRARGDEARVAADRLFVPFMVAMAGLAMHGS
jgi:hypothetical protein